MACMSPIMIHYNELTHKYQYTYDKDCNPIRSIHVACGRCPACVGKWRRELSQRALCEYKKYGIHNCCMLNLTFDLDEDLEKLEKRGHKYCDDINRDTMSLTHEPVKKFFKRLRSYLNYHYPEKQIKFKYLVVGEYGKVGEYVNHSGQVSISKGMPHYHIIIFGWRPDDLYSWTKSKRGHQQMRSPMIEKLWKFGNSTIGEINERTLPYMVKYIVKHKDVKIEDFRHEYTGAKVKKPYIVYPHEIMGIDYFIENYNTILELGYLETQGLDGQGYKCSIPRSWLKYAENCPEMALALAQYKQRIQEHFDEEIEYLKEFDIYTPTDRFIYACQQGQLNREIYNAYKQSKGEPVPPVVVKKVKIKAQPVQEMRKIYSQLDQEQLKKEFSHYMDVFHWLYRPIVK